MENTRHFVQNVLEGFKQRVALHEKQLWDLSAVEGHSAQDELAIAKELLMADRHAQLLESLLKLFSQNPAEEYAFPLKYALTLVQSDQVALHFTNFKIIDVSDEFAKINAESLTEDSIKGFLVLKYDEQQSQASSQWEDENDLFEIEEKDMQDLEHEADRQEEEIIKKEEALRQPQQNEPLQQEVPEQQLLEPEPLPEPPAEPIQIENFDPPKAGLSVHKDLICSFAQHPVQKDIIATGSCDDSFTVTKLSTRETILTQKCSDTVCLLSYSYDGKYLAVAEINGAITIFRVDGKKELESSRSEPTLLEWHPKGYAVLAGFEDSTLWVWNGVNGDVISVLAGHQGPITCGGFSLDGKLALSGSADASFRVWKPSTSLQLHKFSGHFYHSDEVSCFDQKDQLVATGSGDGSICLASVENGKIFGKIGDPKSGVVEVCFIKNAQTILVAGEFSGAIYVINYTQMKVIEKINIAKASISRILYRNTDFFASSSDGKIIQFDQRQLANLKVLQAPSGIYEMIVEEGHIIIGCENGFMYLY